MLKALSAAVTKAGGQVAIVAPKVGGAAGPDGKPISADFQLAGGSSVLFDAVAILLSEQGGKRLADEAAAVAFAHDAFAHLKVIGHTSGAEPLVRAAGIQPDEGIVMLDGGEAARRYADVIAGGRIWDREPKVRTVF